MKLGKKASIRRRLFFGVLLISILLVVSVTGVAVSISYKTMKDQLIANRRMSARWLQDRLTMEVEDYSDQFYSYEVDKNTKADLSAWCSDASVDYTVLQRLITSMNETISMDSSLNSMEIYNLIKDEVVIAKRSGASTEETGDKLELWEQRNEQLQTNLVFRRVENEIILYHESYRFSDKTPLVLMTMHVRPYDLEDILEDIQTTEDESIYIYNDEYQYIDAVQGTTKPEDESLIAAVMRMDEETAAEMYLDGCFYFFRDVAGGKLKILMVVPDSTIVAALKDTLTAGFLLGIIAILISSLGALLFSGMFTRPIIRLSAMMRTITIEDFPGILEQEKDRNRIAGKDEISILQNSFTRMLERNKELIEQEYQAVLEKREAQIRALQAQINPHFMYNTLQVIGGMALKKDVTEVYHMTTALSDILRYSLNFSEDMVMIAEEIQYFTSYIMIQNERFGNKIHLTVKMDEKVRQCLIPKLILQPILENSLEHGLSQRSGDWEIVLTGEITDEVSSKMTGELTGKTTGDPNSGLTGKTNKNPSSELSSAQDLLLTLSDNGIGIPKEQLDRIRQTLEEDTEQTLKSEAHIGLRNVNARLRLNYGEKYGVAIDSEWEKGTTVRVQMKAVLREEGNYSLI